jgi:hypothetical protein
VYFDRHILSLPDEAWLEILMQVKPRFKVGGVADIVDPAMGEDYDPKVLKVMTEVALMSAGFGKNDRPTMKVAYYSSSPGVQSTQPAAII